MDTHVSWSFDPSCIILWKNEMKKFSIAPISGAEIRAKTNAHVSRGYKFWAVFDRFPFIKIFFHNLRQVFHLRHCIHTRRTRTHESK